MKDQNINDEKHKRPKLKLKTKLTKIQKPQTKFVYEK